MAPSEIKQAGGEIYRLVADYCTVESIQALLRDFKPLGREEVKITAENKAALTVVNLQRAVERGVIPINRVYDLLRDVEENGSQHIFLFRLRRGVPVSKYRDWANVASRMFRGSNTLASLPRFLEMPSKLTWADFRAQSLPGHWVAKLYDQHRSYEFVSEHASDGFIDRRYKQVLSRLVLLARFRVPDVLELRVPTLSSRLHVEKKYKALLTAISDGIDLNDFDAWDLSKVRTTLVRLHEKNLTLYRLGDTRFKDSGFGMATFSPPTIDEGLFDATERASAVTVYLKDRESCQESVVTWLPSKATDAITTDVRTVIGSHVANEIVFSASANAKIVDHVLNRLVQFGK